MAETRNRSVHLPEFKGKEYILKTLFTVCTDRLPKFTTINSGIYGIDNREWRDKSLDLRQI
jgi:hypothetical protein